jgi:hypothetical protein
MSIVNVVGETVVVALTAVGPQGPAGAQGEVGPPGPSGSTPYVHTQSTPATVWTINHNLGFRPSVELLDSGGQEIDGDISHPTVNQTVVTLNPATAGLARLI